jgi:hypothetical protein
MSRLDNRSGGVALVVGYLLFLAVLFRDPASGIETATATAQGVLFFLILPALGLGSGVYAYVDGLYQTAVVFVTASYLAMVAITFALFFASQLATAVGVALFALSTVALVGSFRAAVKKLGLTDTLFDAP